MDHGTASSHPELISNLQRAGVITSDTVAAALRLCPRDHFIPEPYKDEAFVDAPIRVELDNDVAFNLSAAHMHCTMVEALDITPGCSVLDVGCGCGVISAVAAVLAGPGGSVVGIDIQRGCCDMSKKADEELRQKSSEYAAAAAPVSFHQLNAFLLTGSEHIGKYDRVHVGASCPPEHVRSLSKLLKPTGGVMIIPVAPSDLRLVTLLPSGKWSHKIISQVRFSDLEVPGDAEVVLTAMKVERKSRMADAVAPSTFDADVAAVIDLPRPLQQQLHDNYQYHQKKDGNDGSVGLLSSSPAGIIDGLPPSPASSSVHPQSYLPKFPFLRQHQYHDQYQYHKPSYSCADNGRGGRSLYSLLGKPDCLLIHAGCSASATSSPTDRWELPAHSALLSQRCDVLRARSNSGMADAALSSVSIPDHFSRPALEAFLHYIYTDTLERICTPELAAEVVHVAHYFGVPRCLQAAEHLLAQVLNKAQKKNASEEVEVAEDAMALLMLADEQGLTHLRAVALDYSVGHFETVAKTEGFRTLSTEQVGAVAEEACRQLQQAKSLLCQMKEKDQDDKFLSGSGVDGDGVGDGNRYGGNHHLL